MKKILLLFFALWGAIVSMAQTGDAEKNAALQFVSANRVAAGLTAEDLNNLAVTHTYVDRTTGLRLVYLQQTYKGIPVYNQFKVLAFKDNKLVSNSGSLLPMEKFVGSKSSMPAVPAESAVLAALTDRGLTATEPARLQGKGKTSDGNDKLLFNTLGVSREPVTAELMWVPAKDGNSISLGWQVYVIPTTTSDYWLVRVDAANSRILDVSNLTVYDNWDGPSQNFMPVFGNENAAAETKQPALFDFTKSNAPTSSIVNGATYRVIPIPAESPQHPGGAPALRTDPWTLAPGNATSLKWHSDGTTDYNYTRGNNVWAYEDRTAPQNSGSPAKSATSTTPDPLTFNFVPDFTVAPTQTTPVQNQQFNITNLFYWVNTLHDVMYQYGFDEPSRNFQDNNQGRGGNGNDHINAEAQDPSGTNNANFSTPADGGSGRMQMFLWSGTPNLDGDVDNGVILHEGTHGTSNRLHPTASCLGNNEQMGEGWSDYVGLMLTQDWANSNLNSGFASPRGIGTYVLGQPVTGVGIRPARYCTDFSVNNFTYANLPSMAIPHGVGFVWCTILWDMTWNIIQQNGTINPNIYDANGTGGNIVALKLVTQGMKLDPCNPGFVDGRNAILAADQALYGGTYACAIKEAFRRRGLGDLASQGSSSSTTDGVPDFSGGVTFKLTQGGITHVPEGQNISYRNTITTSACGGITNYVLTDTLPSNVAFVSATAGGTLQTANGKRFVKWTITQANGTTANYDFVVRIYGGSYYPPVNIITEAVTGATIPASWTAASTTANVWSVVSTQSHSAPNSFFTPDAAVISDQTLATTAAFAVPANPPALSFWHWYNSESTFDGGVVEISTNGGGSWSDIGAANYTQNGYNGTISTAFGSPIAGRAAFTGNSAGFVNSKVNMTPYAGQANVKLRWRFGTDNAVAATGWWLDDIFLQDIAHVDMTSRLYNASGVLQQTADTITLIDPPVGGCVAPEFLVQPRDTAACATGSVTFTASAVSTPPLTYVWQENSGAGFVDLANGGSYSGVTTTTLTINPVTAGMLGRTYRLKAIGCPGGSSTVFSNPATLNVAATPVGGTTSPATTQICSVVNSGTITLSGQTGNVVRWEFSTTSATGPWSPVTPANTTTSLSYSNLLVNTWYRAVVNNSGCTEAASSVATVNVQALPLVTITADAGTVLCQGDPTKLTLVNQGAPTPLTVNQSSSNTPTAGSVSCNSGGLHADNSYWRAFNLAPLALSGPFTVTNVSFGIESADAAGTGTTQPVTVNIYEQTAGTFPGGTRVLRGTQTFNVPDQALTVFTGALTTPAVIPANAVMVMEVFTPSGQVAGHRFFIGSNAAAQTGPSYLSAAACGISTPTDVAAIGFPNMHIIMNASGTYPAAGGTVTGGTFLWTPAAGLSSTTTNPVAASPATTTTYTVTHNNGSGCTRTASITITVNQRPAVTTPPSAVTVCEGKPATFTAVTSGTGAVVQWQVSTTGIAGPYTNITGAPYTGFNTNTLTIPAVTNAMNGNYYRISVSGTCPPVANSVGVLLTVNALPVVTITASSTCGGVAGINGTLLTASSPTGGNFTWTPVTGLYTDATASTPYVAGTPRATVYAAPTVNTVYTATATNGTTGCVGTGTINVNYTPAVPVVTPAAAAICLTTPKMLQQLQITSSLSGYSTSGFTSGPINVAIPEGTFNTGPYNPGVSNIAVSLPAGSVIAQLDVAMNITHAFVGDVIAVLKAPNGKILNLDGALTATNNPGANFVNTRISSAGTKLLSAGVAPFTDIFKADAYIGTFDVFGFPLPAGPVGYLPNTTVWSDLYAGGVNGNWTLALYDAGAPDVGNLTSWSLNFTYSAPTTGIWSVAGSSPAAYTGLYSDAAGTTAYTGAPANIVYASPAVTTTYQVTVANGTCVSQPRTVVVTVNTPVAITTQPQLVVATCTSDAAKFTVVASGTAPTYQWQVSTDNNTWSNVTNGGVYSGATTATLTITAPPLSMNGYQYRVIVKGAAPCGSVTSQQTLLTVNPLPTVVLSASKYSLLPGMTSTITATVTPNPAAANGFTWYRNGTVIPNATTNQITVGIDGLGTYKATVKDVNGCINTSAEISITDSLSTTLFIYPNPNGGLFSVRYHSGMNTSGIARGVNIYDDKGARVYMQKYSVNAPYAEMKVDLRKYGAGTYWVEVVDLNGNRLAVGKVMIVR